MLGKAIPIKMRNEMDADPNMHICMRNALLNDHDCQTDPLKPYQATEWEHVMYYAGSKLNEKWAIISICWLVHRGGKLDKEINQWIALNRATDAELNALDRARPPYIHTRERLNRIYGDETL